MKMFGLGWRRLIGRSLYGASAGAGLAIASPHLLESDWLRWLVAILIIIIGNRMAQDLDLRGDDKACFTWSERHALRQLYRLNSAGMA